MRLWVRLAAVLTMVSVVPLLVNGLWAIELSREQAIEANEEILTRDAEALASFVGTWSHDQLQAIHGWMQLFPLAAQPDEKRQGLLRAIHTAVPTIVTVLLAEDAGESVLDAVYLPTERTLDDVSLPVPAGSDERIGCDAER